MGADRVIVQKILELLIKLCFQALLSGLNSLAEIFKEARPFSLTNGANQG